MRTDRKNTEILFHFLLIAEALLLVAGFSYYMHCSWAEIVRRISIILTSVLLFLFVLEQESRRGLLLFPEKNVRRSGRLLYLLLLPVSAGLGFLPETAWPYPVIFTLLAILGGPLSAVCGGMGLLMMSVFLSSAAPGVFCLYFLAGVFSVMLFTDLEHAFSGFGSLLAQTLLTAFFLACLLFFYGGSGFTPERVVIPVSNLLINLILMVILVRRINLSCLEPRKKAYSRINDQTAPLMERCHDEAPDLYLRAIHVSHFTVRLGEYFGADPYLCKGGGYYSRLKSFPGAPDKEAELGGYMEKAGFPEELRSLVLREGSAPYETTEQMIVDLSNRLVDDILKLKDAGKDITALYPALVHHHLKELYLSDALGRLHISFSQFAGLEDVLLAEKKYLMIL
ncbi:MAG: hypothetical protein K6E50_09885 [Lachnospiraceae bacterium]|nr:hypothetical protein [Lachnospiraceae bacterium]